MDELYRELILDHYKNPRNFGSLPNPTCTAHKNNPFCGDELKVDAVVEDGIIKNLKYSGEGCAISIASASMLSETVKGSSITLLKRIKKDDMVKMLGINLTPTRLKCALLPLEVLQKAVF